MGRSVLNLALVAGLCIMTSQWTVSSSLAQTVGCVADMFRAVGASRSLALKYESALGRNKIPVQYLRKPFILRLLGINFAHATAFHYCLIGKRMTPACKRFKFCSGRGSCGLGKTSKSKKDESSPPPYVCRCTKAGYSGVLCQTDACTASPCKNGGQCVRTTRKPLFKCSCKKGFLGPTCTTKDNLCRRIKPCQNGGTCRPLIADYRCDCANGFSGRRCQNRLLTEKAFVKLVTPLLQRVVSDLKLLHAKGTASNPASSCREVRDAPGRAPSGWYVLLTPVGLRRAYCEMSRWGGGWTRIGQMKPQHTQTCPSAFVYSKSFGGMCTRPSTKIESVSTVSYSTGGIGYSEVMGYVKGYQYYTTDAFRMYSAIAQYYVDGVTFHYGNRHLWSYAGAGHPRSPCPCRGGRKPLSFVGDHYYCTHDATATTSRRWVAAWQGSCGKASTCCPGARDMPWFKRSLRRTTTSPIRVSVMLDQSTYDESIAISDMEVYVR